MSRIKFGLEPITINDIVEIAYNNAEIILSSDKDWESNIRKGSDFLQNHWQEKGVIYGVTTGYGDSCTVEVPKELIEELPLHLTRFHGCGLGKFFSSQIGLAILGTRLASLVRGFSGVRMELLNQLVLLANLNIVPVIPEEGSVGASGDLTPLSYVAAALIGERKVYFEGDIQETGLVFEKLGIQKLKLRPKEGLAIMNGTAVMTAIACIAYARAEYMVKLSAKITALMVEALQGNPAHFLPQLFAVKNHPGQNEVANRIHQDLKRASNNKEHRLQDRYSIRCAPHVIGVLADALPWMKTQIETELNSANDNPIILADEEQILHGGHFYGGHIAFAMDSMKNAVANIADLHDRQFALLMDTNSNNGLPRNLSGAVNDRAAINHGLKAVQIAVSAWAGESLKNSMPASVFSRSTECHNQDKVSMGTISARDCLRSLELTEQVMAASLLAACQAIHIRVNKKQLLIEELSPGLKNVYTAMVKKVPFIEEDMPLDDTLRGLVASIQCKEWDLD